MWLTRLALRNPVLILMMSLMAVALGLVSLGRLSVDLFPTIDMPQVRVATFYPGAGPEDIEKSVTMVIERAVSASPGVDRVESISKEGLSAVTVWFQYGTNIEAAQFDVSQRVSQVLNQLPPGIQQPFVLKFDITNMPVAQVAFASEELDEKQLYDLAYNTVQPQLERLPGVASATVGGGQTREIEVEVHRDALRARKLGILDVVSAVKTSNLRLPGGYLISGDRRYTVYANTEVDGVRTLEDVVVRPNGSALAGANVPPVRVSDVAKVSDATADQHDIVRINGVRGVYLRVQKQPGANTIAVVDGLRKALPNLRGVPPSVKPAISFDQSTYIRNAVTALEHEALQGGLLAIIVVLFFLVSLRATAIVAVAIPLSIVATFILLYFTGQTLNIFTLGGLALGVGRLVDDSIVELENIHRHLSGGQSRKQAVLAAAQEVAMPILVSTVTTIVVFVPVLFLTGVARNLFVPLAMTIAFALTMSFFVSRTVTPLLCLYVLKGGAPSPTGLPGLIERFLTRMDDAYAASLGWVLRHRFVTIALILGLFGFSLNLSKYIGSEFFPETDESQFTAVFKGPVGTRVEHTEQVAIRLEAEVERIFGGKKPTYRTMISDSGLPGGRTALFAPNSGPHAGNVQVNLVGRTERDFADTDAANKLRAAVRDTFPGIQIFMSTGGIVKRIMNFGSGAPIDVEIIGYDLDAATGYARQVMARLRGVKDAEGRPLLTDLQLSREENYPELRVNVDRQKAGQLGVTEEAVAQTVLASLVGSSAFTPIRFTDTANGNEYNINVRFSDAHRSHVPDLTDLFLRTPGGEIVSLDTIATVERESGPVLISRRYMQRHVSVTANVAPTTDLGSASDAVQKVVDELPAPDGFTVQLSGQTAAQKQAFSGLGFAVLLAIALVYMVLASQFRSLVDPLVIMFSVPLGVTGVLLALYLTKTTLSVNSFMGVIMMVGIVVSNGVLLVDFANHLRSRGREISEAVIEAGRTRLRPILMTTIATVVGLVPMALGIGEGSETNLPLARAVIGGLTVSTFFTLFLVPALYTLLDRFARRDLTPDEDEAEGASHA